ncbi:MAG: type 1 glutamine amidotransferase family protein [Acidithiobacillus sp.]
MTITVGFLVFPGLQLLDLAGPYEIFSALPDGDIHLFWKTRESVDCSAGMRFYPTTTLGDGSLVQILNPGVTLDVLPQRLQDMTAQGYRCAAAFADDCCIGVAGIWLGTRF